MDRAAANCGSMPQICAGHLLIQLSRQCALSQACLEQTHYLLDGLEVDEGGMERNLALTKGNVVSEAVMMGLGKTIGRQCKHFQYHA